MTPSDTTRTGWQRLGTISPTALVAARLELHYAAQIPAALGIARARPTADFAQHALTWDAAQRALVSAPTQGRAPHRAGLRLADRTLLVLDGNGGESARLALDGRTLHEALDWLAETSARVSGERLQPLALPEHELPAHPLASGARFGTSPRAELAEIAHWYGNLAEVLAAQRQGSDASPVRVWSHHFDLDSVLQLGGERTLGLGFSPGDDSYAEPYCYVLPTPYPDEHALPTAVVPAEWVTDGWIGAVLRGSKLTSVAASAQAETVARFYRSAIEVLRSLLRA